MNSTARSVLVIGGTSDIGRKVAGLYAGQGWHVMLTSRDRMAGQREVAHIAVVTATAPELRHLDILDTASFRQFVESFECLPDTIVCVVGLLPEQARAASDADYACLVLRTNFEGPAILLGLFAERFEKLGRGTIVGVGSVAGNRGRGSNYVYGSAKAGLTAYLSGLRARLCRSGVRVVTVTPGFVRTRMTAAMRLPPVLTAEPDEVAKAIFEAAETHHRDVVYVRKSWRYVMGVIGALPEPIFKRLSF